jgi:hypothetical protein
MPILIAVASLSLSGAAAMAQSFHRREGQSEQEDLGVRECRKFPS